MNALARHYVGQGDTSNPHFHPNFTILWLGALLFNHPKGIGPAVVSDDDARVSHEPLALWVSIQCWGGRLRSLHVIRPAGV